VVGGDSESFTKEGEVAELMENVEGGGENFSAGSFRRVELLRSPVRKKSLDGMGKTEKTCAKGEGKGAVWRENSPGKGQGEFRRGKR